MLRALVGVSTRHIGRGAHSTTGIHVVVTRGHYGTHPCRVRSRSGSTHGGRGLPS